MAKTRTDVATQVVRVIEADRLPNAMKTGIAKSLLEEGDLVDYVLEEIVTSVGVRAERMYEFARKGGYSFGLPSGQYTNPGNQAADAITAVLRQLHGTSPVLALSYVHWGAPNILHLGWMKLISGFGYDPATNIIGSLTTDQLKPVYLDDLVVVVPAGQATDPISLEQWGVAACTGFTPERDILPATAALIPPTAWQTSATDPAEHVLVKTVQKTTAGLVRTSFKIPTDTYDDLKDFFQVRYTVDGAVKYWLYEDGAGIYTSLDGIYDKAYQGSGEFFPFLYFRHDKKSTISDKSTAEYKSSKRLAKYLGMDYDLVAETINTNPDIADVEQAVMLFAVPGQSDVEIECRYLFDFFNSLYLSQAPSQRKTSQELATTSNLLRGVFTDAGLGSPDIVIQDSRFKMTLRNSGIFKRKVSGKLGDIGTHTSAVLGGKHYYRKQVATNLYDELEVVDLQTVFRIYGDWNTIGDEDDKILIIPLDHSITSNYTIIDRELLYARSMQFVFNSRVVTKLKWYQTGVFKAVLLIVAIVVTIISQGSAWQSIGAALANGAYAAAAYMILTIIVKMAITALVFKLFVKVAGVKVAFIVAIVAALVGIGDAINSGSLSGAPFASELLAASTSITAAIGKEIQSDYNDLLGDYQSLLKEQEKDMKLLEDAKALLNSSVHLNPFVIFGESPNDFYNRTIHSGNIGMVGIDAVSSFVDVKLTLPKLSDTLGIEGV